MIGVFDISSFGYSMAICGVFLLNILIYEGICFGAYLMVCVPIIGKMKDDQSAGRVINVGAMFAALAFIFLVVLYAGGLFRLIPLPQ